MTKQLKEMKAELTRINDQEKKIIQSNLSNPSNYQISVKMVKNSH